MQRLLSLLILLASIGCGWSSPAPHPQAHVFDVTIPHRVHLSYLVFVPASYATTPETHWPLILYLHGGSLCGDDVERLPTVGLPHRLESEPDFPFVVVSPQCPAGEIWTDAEAIDALLDRVVHDYRVDPQRIYITGHSMGGRGRALFCLSPALAFCCGSITESHFTDHCLDRSLRFRSGYFTARQTLPRPSLKPRS